MWTLSVERDCYSGSNLKGSLRPRLSNAAAGRRRTLSDDDLADLVQAVALGQDKRAFATLFEYFAPKLKAFGMRRGNSPSVAEEVAQEAMVSVWRKAASFDPAKASVSTWVFTIVRNKLIDHHRRRPFIEVELDEVVRTVEGEMDPAAGPDHVAEAVQLEGRIREAIKRLPPTQELVLTKAFLEEKSHSEIADELNLPLGTIKSRIRLALGRLRAAIPEVVE